MVHLLIMMQSKKIRSCLTKRGYIDDVIMPHATRARVARALAMLRGKTVEMPGRKHDNLPV